MAETELADQVLGLREACCQQRGEGEVETHGEIGALSQRDAVVAAIKGSEEGRADQRATGISKILAQEKGARAFEVCGSRMVRGRRRARRPRQG